MYRPVILISNPDLKIVETPDRLTFCLSFRPGVWPDEEDWLSDDSAIERECASLGDVLVIQVIREGGTPVQVRIWRPVLSSHELFFTKLAESKIVFADHLRNIIAEMPLDRRTMRDEAVIDFMLFRNAPGNRTYCDGVECVRPGERVAIDLHTGDFRRTQFDVLRNIAEKAPLDTYLDNIDHALEEVTKPLRNFDDAVALFSGGVDSTLLHSYLGTNMPALMGHVWSMDEYEKDYGERAACLLNVPLRTFRVEEHEYLPLLEGAVDASGLLPRFDQVVMTYKAFQQPAKVFVFGLIADSLFGEDSLKGGVVRAAMLLARMPGGRAIAGILGNAKNPRLSRLALLARRFLASPTGVHGFTANDGLTTDMALMKRVFGTRRIEERLQERINGGLPAFEFSARPHDRVGHHLEFSHVCQYLADDGLEQFRHLAQGVGKSFIIPFFSPPVVRSCLRVPVSERYLRGAETKYLLKELLKRRVPDYPVNQKKGAGLIDAERFYSDGPMRGIWERYPLPDVLTGAERVKFMERPNIMSFNMAVLAMWRDRVLRNKALTALPGGHRYEESSAQPERSRAGPGPAEVTRQV